MALRTANSLPTFKPTERFTLENCMDGPRTYDFEHSIYSKSLNRRTSDPRSEEVPKKEVKEEVKEAVKAMKATVSTLLLSVVAVERSNFRQLRETLAQLDKRRKLFVMKIEYATYRAINAIKKVHQRRKSKNDSFIYYGEDLLKVKVW
jgi:hypothetical protein